jgi:hypothetical protein
MITFKKCTQQFLIVALSGLNLCFSDDINSTGFNGEIIRVIKPGVFDYSTNGLLLRMRAWGVGFPTREQPGYNQAISFTETNLIGVLNEIKTKREFDLENLKVVDITLPLRSTTFSRLAIEEGIGWHLEKETNRHGFLVMAQLRAKRKSLGVWATGFDYHSAPTSLNLSANSPILPKIMSGNGDFPTIRYWVTSFGKIHRPGCSFYERGRGELSSRPTGEDCRICGGAK